MEPYERAKLARAAYERAIRVIRANPTQPAWARLLRAAKNLREALADGARVDLRRPSEC
jgi:hypothetical protein